MTPTEAERAKAREAFDKWQSHFQLKLPYDDEIGGYIAQALADQREQIAADLRRVSRSLARLSLAERLVLREQADRIEGITKKPNNTKQLNPIIGSKEITPSDAIRSGEYLTSDVSTSDSAEGKSHA